MKYFIPTFLFLVLSNLFLVSCSNKNNLEDEKDWTYSYQLEKGRYLTKSTDSSFLSVDLPIIEPMLLADSSLLSKDTLWYIYVNKPIVLFKNNNPKNRGDVAGILKSSTMVIKSDIYKKHIFIDSPDAPMSYDQWFSYLNNDSTYFSKYKLTYDTWHEVVINNQKYYTDYDLFDFLEYHVYIPSQKQIMCIASQSTIYDGVYNNGSRSDYVVFVLQQTPSGWEEIFRSEKLHLNVYDEEYSFFDGSIPIHITEKENYFEIALEGLFKIYWNGSASDVIYDSSN